MGEVTDAEVKKGMSGEIVKRHITSLIPLLKTDYSPTLSPVVETETGTEIKSPQKVKRKAAIDSRAKTRLVLANE